MKSAIVTGASGFIGSHLVEQLVDQNFHVTAIVRPNSGKQIGKLAELSAQALGQVDIRFCDILDIDDLRGVIESSAIIYHLAAQIDVAYSLRAPSLFIHTNVTGTHNVLRVALEKQVPRTVVISSSEVYGGTESGFIDEAHPLLARSPYAASKIAAEKIAESYYYSYGLGVVIIRPFNTFGPRQSERAVIPRILSQAFNQGQIILGNLSPIRDFVFVRDTAAGIFAAGIAENIEGQVFNLATGVGRTVNSVVDDIRELLQKKLVVIEDREAIRNPRMEVWRLVGEASKARRQLNWEPKISFNAGLKMVAEYLSIGSKD